MAETKRNPPVKAAIFKETPANTNYDIDSKTRAKILKVIPKQLKFFDSTPNPNPTSINLKNQRRTIPSRMLIYEDSSEEDEDTRSTPPNIQDGDILGTPGAPMKFRKEIDKKVLRPKKLVYNDRENENKDSIERESNHQFYHSTPKRYDEGGDYYCQKFINMTMVIPKKILPVIEEDVPTRNMLQNRSRTRSQGNRRKKVVAESRKTLMSMRSTVLKIDDFTSNKENHALQFGVENNVDEGETGSGDYFRSNGSSVKNDRSKEESSYLSKTHFRI